MIKRFRILGLVLALAALFGGVNIGAAQAVSNNHISLSYVESWAGREGNGSGLVFEGTLQSKGANQCYQMQQKTPAGNWTTAGFLDGFDVPTNPLNHCTNDAEHEEFWSIPNGLNVRGVRGTNGVNTFTHCDSATNCRNMYPAP